MHRKTTLLLFWMLTGSLFAQSNVEGETQFWFDVTKFFPLADELGLGGDAGIRGFVLDGDWTVVYVRPTLKFDPLNTFSLRGGVGVFYAFQDGPKDIVEVRPWAGTLVRWPRIKKLRLQHRFRADLRFRKRQQLDFYTSVLRLRYRIGTTVPIGAQAGPKTFYIPISFELLMDSAGDLNARFINASRFVAGLGYRISDHWRIELNYTRILVRLDASDPLRSRFHVLRIQIKG